MLPYVKVSNTYKNLYEKLQNGRETDKAQPENCIVGEEVVNLLNGKKYLFTEDLAQSLHLPTRLIKKG